MPPERVLVTGGAGYLGAVLIPYLLAEGYAVRVLDTFSHSYPSLTDCVPHEAFEPVRGDCSCSTTLGEALQGVDWVIPLAAVVGAPACDRDPFRTQQVNVRAISLLMDHVSGMDRTVRVLYPNTNSGYGTTAKGVICGENTPLKPVSLYGVTKAKAEELVLENENTLSFRLATVFGASPHMRLDLLVNDFVYRAVKDRVVVLYEAQARRNYMAVYDVARMFVFAMRNFDKLSTNSDRVYNAGLAGSFTKKELCEAIQKYVRDFFFFEAEVGKDVDARDYEVSVEKLEAAGFKCCVSLTAGIRELIKYYKMMPIERFRNA